MASTFEPRATYAANGYGLLPFRFGALDSSRYILVNEVGEYHVLANPKLSQFVRKELAPCDPDLAELKSKHFAIDDASAVSLDLLVLKRRTKQESVARFTSLHMFVVTLRCNHSCKYCQVSRQSEDRAAFDMTQAMADRAIEFTFRTPSPAIKIEFQGGEPLLNFPLIKYIVLNAKDKNREACRDLSFVIATNLSVVEDEVLAFCLEHDILLSTSLDGPEDLHNSNRPNTGHNSYAITIEGIRRARETLGFDRVSALMTTTRLSLPRVTEIIDEYIKQGFNAIFLRNLSPFGFAIKTRAFAEYGTEEWIQFYERGLRYIIQLNKNGFRLVEIYASILLSKILTPYGTGYVNLQSPAGVGIAGIIFNYNGEVYPSDEARMKAEMGDKIFRMGHLLENTYEEMMLSPALLDPLAESLPEVLPMCDECEFLSYCGADPDYHYATQGDFAGHKAKSGFCKKNKAVFRLLFQILEDDPDAARILLSWVRW